MVFVLDANGQPLMPCTEKRVRLLLERILQISGPGSPNMGSPEAT
jgi:hypothetical protein